MLPSDHRTDAGADTTPEDTTPEARVAQRDIYRRMGGARRLSVAFDLSGTVRGLTTAGIRGRHPGYTDEQVLQAWARLSLGDDLARALWPDRPLVEP